jgi:hypothetical protein
MEEAPVEGPFMARGHTNHGNKIDSQGECSLRGTKRPAISV